MAKKKSVLDALGKKARGKAVKRGKGTTDPRLPTTTVTRRHPKSGAGLAADLALRSGAEAIARKKLIGEPTRSTRSSKSLSGIAKDMAIRLVKKKLQRKRRKVE